MLKRSDVLALIEQLPEEFDEEALWRACSQAASPDGEWVSPDCELTKEQRDSVVETHKAMQREGGIPFEEAKERISKWVAALS